MIDFLLILLGVYLVVAVVCYFVLLVALWGGCGWVGNLFMPLFFALAWPYILGSYTRERAKTLHWLFLCAFLLPACSGPNLQRKAGETEIKTPAGHRVTIKVTADNTVTVTTEPIPIWQKLVEGATLGLVRGLKQGKQND